MKSKTDLERRTFLRTIAAAFGAAFTSTVLSRHAAAQQIGTTDATAPDHSKGRATIVLAHGAWADGSSWSAVIRPLQSMGLPVIAAPLPLTSLTDDVAALDRVVERTE